MITKRFIIRSLNGVDANANYVSWFDDVDVKKYILSSKKQITIQYLEKFIFECNEDKSVLLFGIFNKKNKHIGNIKFDKINQKKNQTIMGILIGNKKYRGKGVACEVIEFFSKFFYLKYCITNIYLGVNKNNVNAIKAYTKIDFKISNYLKNNVDQNKYIMVKKYELHKKIIVGTAQFLDNYGINRKLKNINLKKKINIIESSLKNKFIYFDTSNSYSEYSNVFNNIHDHQIILKLNPEKDIINYDLWVKKIVNKYLKIFKVKSFYAIMIHNEEVLNNINFLTFYKSLLSLKQKKITKRIGISIYSFQGILKKIKLYKFDLIQCPFSLIDQRLLENNLLNDLKKNNIEIHIRSIFLQGLIFKTNLNPYFDKWKKLLKKIEVWSKKNSLTKIESALFFTLNFQKIDKIVIGMENNNQIKQISNALKKYKYLKYPKYFKNNDISLINPNKWKL